MRRCSPSSSEGALTSLRPDLPLGRRDGGAPSLDKFLDQIGHRYQIIIMFLLSANSIPIVVNHLLMAFYAVSTPHNCRPPDNATRSLWLPLEESTELSISSDGHSNNQNLSIAKLPNTPQYSKCHMYIDGNNHSLGQQSCVNGYEFHFENSNEWNIVAEWGLVCNRQYVAPLITTVYFSGVMLGGIIFGSLSDRYGRKYMMLVCLYTQCLIGVGLHFVRRLVVFIGLRFIQGIFIQGLQCVTYSMVMELFAPQYRALAGCVIEAFWATGVITLALIAKYVQHWRYIQLAINIPTIATLFYIWIIPESVRWLLSRGKLNRAEKIVKRIASCNGIKLDPICLRVELEDVGRNLLLQNPTGKRPDIRDICKQRGIRRHAFAMFFIWFAVSLAYYGISYTIPNLSGDRYLNFIIGGGIELAAYMLAFVVLNGFGRKYPLMIYLFLSGALCISVVSVRTFMPASWIDVDSLAIGLALVGKAAVVSCFCTIFIYSNEIFPTVIRTVGVGACAFFGRIGSLLAPQLLLLGEYLYSESPQLVTFLTFGICAIIAALLTLLLPETLDRDLPDTVQDANYMSSNPHNQERPSSMAGDDTTTMSGMEIIANKGNGSEHGGQNTLLRMQGGTLTRIHSPIIEETNYGKSPEWVEIDGLIVSKSHLTPSHLIASNNGTLSRQTPNNNQTTIDRQPKFDNLQVLQASAIKSGSVTSLPYCSQTLASSNYSSTLEGSNSTTTTQEGSHGMVMRKSSNDSSDSKNIRRTSHLRSLEQNQNSNVRLQSQLPGGSKTLPNKNQNGKIRTKVKHSKPPVFVYQTTSSRSTTSGGSSSCCSRSSSDCCSCHTDCPRDDIHNRYPAPPPPRKVSNKQIPPPPPTNPPPPLSHHHNQLFLDRKNSFELLQDEGGESQSERESENQYETIPSGSLPVLESDFEETDTDVQTIDVDSYEESGNDSRCESSRINPREISRILKSNKNINDALKNPYYQHRGYGVSEEGPQTLESSLEPDESQDTSVISAQHSGLYDIGSQDNKRPTNRHQNDKSSDYRNNNHSKYKSRNVHSNNINNNTDNTDNTIHDKAKLQGYIFRKRLLMAEANETIL